MSEESEAWTGHNIFGLNFSQPLLPLSLLSICVFNVFAIMSLTPFAQALDGVVLEPEYLNKAFKAYLLANLPATNTIYRVWSMAGENEQDNAEQVTFFCNEIIMVIGEHAELLVKGVPTKRVTLTDPSNAEFRASASACVDSLDSLDHLYLTYKSQWLQHAPDNPLFPKLKKLEVLLKYNALFKDALRSDDGDARSSINKFLEYDYGKLGAGLRMNEEENDRLAKLFAKVAIKTHTNLDADKQVEAQVTVLKRSFARMDKHHAPDPRLLYIKGYPDVVAKLRASMRNVVEVYALAAETALHRHGVEENKDEIFIPLAGLLAWLDTCLTSLFESASDTNRKLFQMIDNTNGARNFYEVHYQEMMLIKSKECEARHRMMSAVEDMTTFFEKHWTNHPNMHPSAINLRKYADLVRESLDPPMHFEKLREGVFDTAKAGVVRPQKGKRAPNKRSKKDDPVLTDDSVPVTDEAVLASASKDSASVKAVLKDATAASTSKAKAGGQLKSVISDENARPGESSKTSAKSTASVKAEPKGNGSD